MRIRAFKGLTMASSHPLWTRPQGVLVLAAVLTLAPTPSRAQEDEAQPGEEAAAESDTTSRPTLRIHPIPGAFVFDGRTDQAEWSAVTDSIANLVTVEPEEGGAPAGRTIVKVVADEDHIVVGVRCYDNDPAGIVSFSKARDSDLSQEDHVVLVLDTFRDERSGYVFAVNPAGARFDGLVVKRGDEVNSNWDTIWEARTSTDAAGWSAEIRIPIKSLSYARDLTSWGFNVQRRVQRLQETSRWSGINRDQEIFQTGQAGLLSHLPKFDLGVGASIRPAAVGRAAQVGIGQRIHFDGDLSLDMTQRLGPNVSSAFTVNTDFAETEVDVRQINLTRFPVFFPEKRSFFLEGADIFDFGLALDERTLIPFFSRRIGLFGLDEEDQAEIPINAGAKVNGRLAGTSFGALAVNTRKVHGLAAGEGLLIDVPQTTLGALRIKQDILEESSVGVIATTGDRLDRSGSWSAGLDFIYQTSELRGDKNFLVGVWGLLNDRDGVRGDKSAYGATISYPNDLLDVTLTSIRIGNGFDPSLGYAPRNDVHLWDFTAEFVPRPPWALVRQMFHELSLTLFNDHDDRRWQTYEATVKPLDWLLESGDRFEVSVEREGDRPPTEFEIADNVDIGPGTYEWFRSVIAARSAEKRRISGEIRCETGEFYNGDLTTIAASLALKPSALLALELSVEDNTGEVRPPGEAFDRSFNERLYGARLQINLSPNLQASSLTQYDTNSRLVGSNNRVRWTFHPLGDLFFVHNHNWENSRLYDLRFVASQSVLKIQYAWRF
jgi:uncharacterized protein DUF5916